MSYIRTLPNGKFRAEISKNYTSIQSKTFPTQNQAEQWADSVEINIEEILNIKPKKLKKLSPDKVEELGGLALFLKLGVEIEFLTFKAQMKQCPKLGKHGPDISSATPVMKLLNGRNIPIPLCGYIQGCTDT